MSLLKPELIKSLFPKTSFSFQSNYVHRYRNRYQKVKPSIDVFLATKDLKQFHKENLAMNRQDYTVSARLTKAKLIHYFQNRGAKVHFNIKAYKHQTEDGRDTTTFIRYGIVDEKDLLRDLKYWETLCTSSFMQRPHLILNPSDQVREL